MPGREAWPNQTEYEDSSNAVAKEMKAQFAKLYSGTELSGLAAKAFQ
jgi:hypothetical protein